MVFKIKTKTTDCVVEHRFLLWLLLLRDNVKITETVTVYFEGNRFSSQQFWPQV